MRRSFWKVPKSAMDLVDESGAPVPPFLGGVIYHETAQFVYVMSDRWARQNEVAPATRENLNLSAAFNRYVRTLVRHDDEEKTIERVRASQVLPDDVVLEADVPAVLFAGDTAEDVLGTEAMATMAAAGG